jgi:DNA-binding CsgD family transcriptional regulator
MERLRHSDLKRLFQAVSELYSDTDSESLSTRTLSAVQAALDSDFTAFDLFAGDNSFVDNQWNTDTERLNAEITQTFSEIFNASPSQHPLAALLNGSGLEVFKASDFVKRGDFKKTEFYNEFFHKVEVEYQMSVVLPVDAGTRISCSPSRRLTDFDEHDRSILFLLAPHLRNAIRASIELRKMREHEQRLENALDVFSRGLLCIAANGRVLSVTRLGVVLLRKYFQCEVYENCMLPEEFNSFIKRFSPRSPGILANDQSYTLRLNSSELRIVPLIDASSDELSLLLTEKSEPGIESFRFHNLTKRESEVLYWIAKGKTDEVIGFLLGISIRTVQKHVEHILKKMGAETRMAAAGNAFDRINSSLADS